MQRGYGDRKRLGDEKKGFFISLSPYLHIPLLTLFTKATHFLLDPLRRLAEVLGLVKQDGRSEAEPHGSGRGPARVDRKDFVKTLDVNRPHRNPEAHGHDPDPPPDRLHRPIRGAG